MSGQKAGEDATGGPAAAPDCAGKTRAGKPCRYRAVAPAIAPRWCGNCDPSPEAVIRRSEAGRTRHRRFARAPKTVVVDGEIESGPLELPAASAEPTVDYIVDLCLSTARLVRAGKVAPNAGFAMSRLFGKALDAMKARGSTGDARGSTRAAKGPPAPAGTVPPPSDGESSLDELARQLDA